MDLVKLKTHPRRMNRIAEFRRKKGMTQGNLAERIGKDQSSISKVERSVEIASVAYLRSIAEALDVQPGDLIDPKRHSDGAEAIAAIYDGLPESAQRAVRAMMASYGEDAAPE
jgi:transcriptional regulator with XRE-family HTH domain